MVGHAAEYLKQAQDWLADSYFQDGAAGRPGPSTTTKARLARARADMSLGSKLFGVGDYLHAMYAMRNAALHGQGVTGKAVAPHRLTLDEAAHHRNAIFAIHAQKVYRGTAQPSSFPAQWVGTGKHAAAPSSGIGLGLLHTLITPARDLLCHIHWP